MFQAALAICFNFRVHSTCKVDLGVILDESGSVSHSDYALETKFVKDLTRYFTIGKASTVVSVISFSKYARLKFQFRDYAGYNRYYLNYALNRLRRAGE